MKISPTIPKNINDLKCTYCKQQIITHPGMFIEFDENGFHHEACRKSPYTEQGEIYIKQVPTTHDPVNAPSHYLQTKISPLEVIEDWKLDFHLGSVIKYIGRHPHKGAPLEDLKKAQWYLARKIKLMEEQNAG